ncbi:MAG: sn-glycerol-3-phosphate ABC transporter ATP-binding protein UgpC, partial [Bacillota bacterium]|nr:sn-glycerol-3-phosphate ABC transporter ATP-binding protein UgpC [Bacillota bacterium]
MASVSLKNVYKRYEGGVVAVSDFNIDIEDKEFIILVGPSGCGKSTTLRMIAGLEEITEGEIYIGEKLVNDVQPKDRDIAMVFQNYALYPHMTVYDNMAFGLKLRKVPKDEIKRRVTEAAKILEIEHLLDRKPKALSGGQRQRVALGRAIVRDPKVFLMDEPLSNLDAKLRVQMRVEITKLHQRLQTTIIYVTHDQTEAMTMGTRIVVMKDGFIQQIDNPTNLYLHPQNTFVAGFIGMPPMNFINAKLTVKGDDVFLNFNDITIALPKKYSTPEVKAYDGKEVITGIRPEAITDDVRFVERHPETQF